MKKIRQTDGDRTIFLRLTIVDMDTCPICDKCLGPDSGCKPLYNNQKVIGYAHNRCFNILNKAINQMCGD